MGRNLYPLVGDGWVMGEKKTTWVGDGLEVPVPITHGCHPYLLAHQFQNPPRPSNTSFTKQARYAYINQFPKMFHAFIDRVRDVKVDGNCEF